VSIDRADSYIEGAGTWHRACRHIAVFLWWAADRGLASKSVDAKAIAKAPIKYFIAHCDMKLWDDDLGTEGGAFAAARYDTYLRIIDHRATELGIDGYQFRLAHETNTYFFGVLDGLLAEWREVHVKAPKKPAAKAKKKKR
jgi:hypothetical protein